MGRKRKHGFFKSFGKSVTSKIKHKIKRAAKRVQHKLTKFSDSGLGKALGTAVQVGEMFAPPALTAALNEGADLANAGLGAAASGNYNEEALAKAGLSALEGTRMGQRVMNDPRAQRAAQLATRAYQMGDAIDSRGMPVNINGVPTHVSYGNGSPNIRIDQRASMPGGLGGKLRRRSGPRYSRRPDPLAAYRY